MGEKVLVKYIPVSQLLMILFWRLRQQASKWVAWREKHKKNHILVTFIFTSWAEISLELCFIMYVLNSFHK